MLSVLRDSTTELVVTYNVNVSAGAFSTGDFIATSVSPENPTSIAQETANSLRLTFAVDISDDDTLTYSGTVSGVLTPQSITIP